MSPETTRRRRLQKPCRPDPQDETATTPRGKEQGIKRVMLLPLKSVQVCTVDNTGSKNITPPPPGKDIFTVHRCTAGAMALPSGHLSSSLSLSQDRENCIFALNPRRGSSWKSASPILFSPWRFERRDIAAKCTGEREVLLLHVAC